MAKHRSDETDVEINHQTEIDSAAKKKSRDPEDSKQMISQKGADPEQAEKILKDVFSSADIEQLKQFVSSVGGLEKAKELLSLSPTKLKLLDELLSSPPLEQLKELLSQPPPERLKELLSQPPPEELKKNLLASSSILCDEQTVVHENEIFDELRASATYQKQLDLVKTLGRKLGHSFSETFYEDIPPEDVPENVPEKSSDSNIQIFEGCMSEFVAHNDLSSLLDISKRMNYRILEMYQAYDNAESNTKKEKIRNVIGYMNAGCDLIANYISQTFPVSDLSVADRVKGGRKPDQGMQK